MSGILGVKRIQREDNDEFFSFSVNILWKMYRFWSSFSFRSLFSSSSVLEYKQSTTQVTSVPVLTTTTTTTTIRLFPQSSQYITNQINVQVKQTYSGWTPEITVIIKYSPMLIRFQAIWLVRWSPVISLYSSDWLYMKTPGNSIYLQINICRWKIICCCI